MDVNRTLRKETPSILATLGVVGFLTSVWMTAKAAPKAKDILEELPEDAPMLDKVKAVAPIYAPTVGTILLSIAFVMSSNRMHRYRYASVLALYSIGERSLEKWQTAVLKEVGPKKYEKAELLTMDPNEDPNPPPTAILLDDDKVLMYDVFSGRYFKVQTVEVVRSIVNRLNEQILAGDWISVNDYYFELGLEPLEYGGEWGWTSYRSIIEIRTDAFLKDDRPVVSVSFINKPKEYYK